MAREGEFNNVEAGLYAIQNPLLFGANALFGEGGLFRSAATPRFARRTGVQNALDYAVVTYESNLRSRPADWKEGLVAGLVGSHGVRACGECPPLQRIDFSQPISLFAGGGEVFDSSHPELQSAEDQQLVRAINARSRADYYEPFAAFYEDVRRRLGYAPAGGADVILGGSGFPVSSGPFPLTASNSLATQRAYDALTSSSSAGGSFAGLGDILGQVASVAGTVYASKLQADATKDAAKAQAAAAAAQQSQAQAAVRVAEIYNPTGTGDGAAPRRDVLDPARTEPGVDLGGFLTSFLALDERRRQSEAAALSGAPLAAPGAAAPGLDPMLLLVGAAAAVLLLRGAR